LFISVGLDVSISTMLIIACSSLHRSTL
jgi:hypothetical protein